MQDTIKCEKCSIAESIIAEKDAEIAEQCKKFLECDNALIEKLEKQLAIAVDALKGMACTREDIANKAMYKYDEPGSAKDAMKALEKIEKLNK